MAGEPDRTAGNKCESSAPPARTCHRRGHRVRGLRARIARLFAAKFAPPHPRANCSSFAYLENSARFKSNLSANVRQSGFKGDGVEDLLHAIARITQASPGLGKTSAASMAVLCGAVITKRTAVRMTAAASPVRNVIFSPAQSQPRNSATTGLTNG